MIRFDQIEYACLTDVGVKRSHNQDAHAVQLASDEEQWRSRGHLFLVADGMGAHAVGEKASELAARVVPHTYVKYAAQGAPVALRKALIEANASIHACGQANREFKGMGTTGSALLLRPEGAWIGHVGDSRVYRIRQGGIEQLSYDHSLLWEYARIKGVDPDDVTDIPSNVIHRCLGPEPLVKVDIEGPHPLADGDTFLLCSDGLSGQVTDMEIGAIATQLAPADACRFLVDLANLRGGPDNITVVIVRLKEGQQANGVPPAGTPAARRWLRVPWWLLALLAGSLLAGLGAWLTVEQLHGGMSAFTMGALCIFAGLIGLLLDYRREQQRQQQDEEEPARARVHRRHSCLIDLALVDKVVRALSTLRVRAEERNANPDWQRYQTHLTTGEEAAAKNDWPAAFREYCLAVLPLTQALNKLRGKEEVFQPMWDKMTNKSTDTGRSP